MRAVFVGSVCISLSVSAISCERLAGEECC
jgi:hypothetical protein